ncbi:hypothetical protein PQR12_23715 [Paraburkholderia nemoris]|uniref:hypothetical protein n=1 Tax=Paraburkholderia nemoris TaxID=2793076 RepID=UPI0038B7F41C
MVLRYQGYNVWGHAILQQEDILQSGLLGYFDAEEEAQQAGLGRARAWVDAHG